MPRLFIAGKLREEQVYAVPRGHDYQHNSDKEQSQTEYAHALLGPNLAQKKEPDNRKDEHEQRQ